ncbi:MAG TPA: alpha/beta hydrolase [Acidimicrobiales bacterium]|nr:alpha/beta hydrolase [Acidimicrobiales bacterium]
MPAKKIRGALLLGAAAAAGAAAVGLAVHRTVETMKSRTDPEIDPLLDLPADVSHRYIPAQDGGSLHVIERGSGRPLLLIHGVTLQAGVWSPQFHLMADRYRVLAMDVRGHGKSVAGSDGFGRTVAARDVATVLDHLDLRDVIIVGHSMGGMITMEFAGDFPDELGDRVAGLVFMDTAAHQILPRAVLPVAKLLGRQVHTRFSAGKAVPERSFGDDDVSWLMTRVAFGRNPSAKAIAQVRGYLEDVPQSTSLPSWVDLLDHDARDALRATKTPSLVLVGSRDLLTPVYAAKRIASFLPDARFEVLEGAGHQLMQERPYEVARLLDEFASQTSAG